MNHPATRESNHETIQHPRTVKHLSDWASPRRQALLLFWEAHRAACELNLDAWALALQLDHLRAAGATDTTLRWFVAKGYVEHRLETTLPTDALRTFLKQPNLRFLSTSCFHLTDSGIELVRQLFADQVPNAPEFAHAALAAGAETQRLLPHWHHDQRILSVGNIVVKLFKVPAKAQELVLAAFQEENWPARLDDPLPPLRGIAPKQRLHEVIRRLNHHQKTKVLQFEGDGNRRGIRWRYLRHDLLHASAQHPHPSGAWIAHELPTDRP